MEIILVNTLMKSLNDNEVGDMIRFAAKNTDIVRGLIFQPIAFTGRATENPFRENFREWSFAEDVEKQTGGEIKTTDLYPMSVMTSPIKIMRKFMQKALATVLLQPTMRNRKLDLRFKRRQNVPN